MKKSKHKAKFRRPEDHLPPLLQSFDKKVVNEYAFDNFKNDYENLMILCDEYNIEQSEHMFFNLSLELAREFIPEHKAGGNKKKWNMYTGSVLVVDFNRERFENGKITQLQAAKNLAKHPVWKKFLLKSDMTTGQSPEDAILKQFKNYRNNEFVNLVEDARLISNAQGDTNWWNDMLKQVLLNAI